MTGKKYYLTLILCLATSWLLGQELIIQVDSLSSNTKALIIGLDAWNDQHIWASGTNGTILKSKDGGNSWNVYLYKKADTLQFRAIKGLSTDEALVMSAGEGKASQIFKFSISSGWTQLYEMPYANGFLDAIELLPDGSAIAYGDAIDSSYFILKSDEQLNNWERVLSSPKAGKGEGGFASSGTNIAVGEKGEAWIGTGAGGYANILKTDDYGNTWKKYNSPMLKGPAAGITSIRQINGHLFIAGGDLAIADEYTNNLFYSDTNMENWIPLSQPVSKGAFYGAALTSFEGMPVYLICGPSGADIWLPNKEIWINISDRNLWTVEFINDYTAIIAGRNGYMLKVTLKD